MSLFLPAGSTRYTVPWDTYLDFSLACEIQVGTPQQSMMVNVMTANEDTAVVSSRCADCEGNKFILHNSSTFAVTEPEEYFYINVPISDASDYTYNDI